MLANRQLIIMLAFGLAFWLIVALLIRIAPSPTFAGGGVTALLFALSIPIAWASVLVAKALGALAPDQLVSGVAIASAAALLCDAIGLVWSRFTVQATACPPLPGYCGASASSCSPRSSRRGERAPEGDRTGVRSRSRLRAFA